MDRLSAGWGRRSPASGAHWLNGGSLLPERTKLVRPNPVLLPLNMPGCSLEGGNRAKRQSQCRGNGHLGKDLAQVFSINAAVSSLTALRVPRPGITQSSAPGACTCTQTGARPRGAHPLPGGIRPLPAAAFPSCHDRCEEEPASSQADPGAFASLIPTLLPPTACIRWSWDASQPTNGTYLHSPQNSQSKPYSEVEK